MFGHGAQRSANAEFIRDLRAGLMHAGQKELPSLYLYDEIGAALFEVITLLPEYGLTRADARLIERHAPEITERVAGPVIVAELGSGSGRKTRWILEALARRRPLTYYPIDISHSALVKCRGELGRLDGVTMVEVEQPYLEGLDAIAARRKRGQVLMVLFLGSTIGNFDRAGAREFLTKVRERLAVNDALLLGTDLVKPVPQLLAAYNDPIGATAAFNLNVLARINRELGGEFVLADFQHQAIYNSPKRRIEMHLRSKRKQKVRVRDADLTVSFAAAESIWTESSHKFRVEELPQVARAAGFRMEAQWVDQEWPFAESLLIATR
ncbi:MAG TPA: L-histidine N(alpha)-methyltransferase [Bryobacteraceae bacterium]|nr:L-histidine N(alpha)-methyltransferase [Bryobacteraceae bacterium]